MRKIIAGLAAIALIVGACGCAASTAEPATLIGEWCTKGEPSMSATITADEIIVRFITDESAALYWQGTCDGTAASWTSTNTRGEEFSLFASDAETKKFSYIDGTIQFPLTAMGVEMTVVLERMS